MAHSRIGLVTCIHPRYDSAIAIQQGDAAASGLQGAGCQVVVREVARTSQDVPGIMERLQAAGIDLLVFFFCTSVDEEITFRIAHQLQTVPLLLWALPYFDLSIPTHSPITGITSTGCNLRRAGRLFLHRIGECTPTLVGEIARIARNASLVGKLRNARFGIFGLQCPGAIDTTCDDSLLRKHLGVATYQSSIEDVLRARDAASEIEALNLAQKLEQRTGRSEVALETVVNQCRMVIGMKSLVQEHSLDGFAVRCWPELREQNNNTICLAMSELAEAGIVSACEADSTALITSYILTSIAAQPSCTLEMTAYLEQQDALQFAHCGSAAISLARNKNSAVIRNHMKTGTGAVIEFPFKPKLVTLAKILRPFESGMKLFAARGEIIPTTNGHTRGTVATIQMEPSAEHFVDSILHYQVEHHMVMVYGDWLEDLGQFAQLARVEYLTP